MTGISSARALTVAGRHLRLGRESGKAGVDGVSGQVEEMNSQNGAAAASQPDPELAAKIAALRAHVRESFGKAAMAMMMLPRYRHQTLGDLQKQILNVDKQLAAANGFNADLLKLQQTALNQLYSTLSQQYQQAIAQGTSASGAVIIQPATIIQSQRKSAGKPLSKAICKGVECMWLMSVPGKPHSTQ